MSCRERMTLSMGWYLDFSDGGYFLDAIVNLGLVRVEDWR
jgi:hypothetical protein